jgi:hypothetical protein
MGKTVKLTLAALAVLVAVVAARAEEKVVVNLNTGELAFSLNLLNSIELAGGEVGPGVVLQGIEQWKKGLHRCRLYRPHGQEFPFLHAARQAEGRGRHRVL